ncbi:helicase-related protein [Elioraea tepidiphila]|uniref:helicase-related protein n=1 Tax=Elioraea tepidiphila TaxID=457934 RepID=UPI000477BDBA|nr:helicase-related protein [Elioraea tepidiphila]
MHGAVESARVRAVLGPTNTGKTHLAIERMLAHATGVIGFPLRLLARENYDRIAARMGPARVALVTGEEKIVPPGARWFCCTVEAMPLDRPFAFLAVDEIQLCADPDRGHVFTDRLLHARGRAETMFLGAETIRPLLRRLVPEAEIETRPRLSALAYAGHAKLSRLPPRSAIVAFSAAEVYAIAEALRRRRGGCAVVMGRLSPRTRNAQVAMYQAKEVDFLVATDAIGMGLNMDVNHVAFAGLAKFDGHRARGLYATEVAQIAGRAGRGMADGSFGTTAEAPALGAEIVEAVEAHRFDPLDHLVWRNSRLDFQSVGALLAALDRPPPGPGLVRGPDAADHLALASLARDPDTAGRARGREAVALLWDACQVPDYRRLGDDSHARICARIFRFLREAPHRVDPGWVNRELDVLDRTDGELDTLMARIASVRTWSYIAGRPGWLAEPAPLIERCRALEDRISDALHETLTARFVDRRAAHLIRRLDAASDAELLSAVTRDGTVVVEGHAVGRVDGFVFHPDPEAEGVGKQAVLRAARRAMAAEVPRRVAALEADEDTAFAFTAAGRIAWRGAEVARLKPGASALRPLVEVPGGEFLDGAQRERIRARLAAWLAARIAATLGPLLALGPAAADPALRGLAHLLEEGLGVVPREQVIATGLDRGRLKALGVRLGRHAAFLPALLRPGATALRARLWAVRRGVVQPPLPTAGTVAVRPDGSWPEGWVEMLGFLRLGPVAVRLDVAERVGAELARLTRAGAQALPSGLPSRLGCRAGELPAVLRGLGFALRPGEDGAIMVRARRRAPAAPPAESRGGGDGPFAALASLRAKA